MPLEQTITIVNNSGKIISTGKQLLSIFKEAKGAYQDKKAALKSERSPLRRAQTFDPARSVYRSVHGRELEHEDHHHHHHQLDDHDCHYDEYEYGPDPHDDGRGYEHHDGGLAADYYGHHRAYDLYSETSSRRSKRTTATRHGRHRHSGRSRTALTESNLKTLSEVSSTAPSKAPPPAAYRSPYAETLPLDMALSRMDLNRSVLAPAPSMMVPRRCSEPQVGGVMVRNTGEEIDMHLAYGNIPPDLADRVDLDPGYAGGDQWTAHQLVHKVEGLLDEAHCLQHSATAIIKHLQEKPEAAAAVALTLAELSAAVAKMSPAFLGLLKGGSPAVFALLASPQFLIGSGIAVGVTVVMFGGWRIVKKVKEAQAARELLLLHAHGGGPPDRPVPLRTQSDYGGSAGIDEALVVDDELSTIETWRRGIAPFGADDESADLELITPEADRATRQKHSRDDIDADLRSRRSGRTHRSSGTHKTSHRDKGKEREAAPKAKEREAVPKAKEREAAPKAKEREGVPERKSSRSATVESVSGDSERSRRSSKSKQPRSVKAIEDGRSRRGDDELVLFRPKLRQDNMLKAIFRSKKDKEKSRGELVLA